MAATDIRDITSFKWATVVGVNPISIKLDGDSLALALIPDSLVDPLSLFVGSRVRVELSLRKCVIHGVSNGGEAFGAGDIMATARGTARPGWMLMQGQSLLRADYPGLFAAIGTTYGAANGSSFSLPDTRGRVLVGFDSGVAQFNTLGKAGGATTHTHTLTTAWAAMTVWIGGSQLWIKRLAQVVGGPWTYNVRANVSAPAETSPTAESNAVALGGSTDASDNLQPYITANYMIKL